MTDKVDAQEVEWLRAMADYSDLTPRIKQPFIRTQVIGEKEKGCFITGHRNNVTRHHIIKGDKPVVVYLQWKYHQIIHGVGLNRFRIQDIRTTYAVAETYNLWKTSEANIVKKKILTEIDRRKFEINFTAFFRHLW